MATALQNWLQVVPKNEARDVLQAAAEHASQQLQATLPSMEKITSPTMPAVNDILPDKGLVQDMASQRQSGQQRAALPQAHLLPQPSGGAQSELTSGLLGGNSLGSTAEGSLEHLTMLGQCIQVMPEPGRIRCMPGPQHSILPQRPQLHTQHTGTEQTAMGWPSCAVESQGHSTRLGLPLGNHGLFVLQPVPQVLVQHTWGDVNLPQPAIISAPIPITTDHTLYVLALSTAASRAIL